MANELKIRVNEQVWTVAATPDMPLLYVLSNELNLQGNTIILVTHEHDIAEHAHRVLHILDGRINLDERR